MRRSLAVSLVVLIIGSVSACSQQGGPLAGDASVSLEDMGVGEDVDLLQEGPGDLQGVPDDLWTPPTGTGLCTPLPNRWCWENPLPQGNELTGAWSFSPSDTWTVGGKGTIMHHDGAAWSMVPSGTQEALLSIWGRVPTDIWVVGSRGTILRWNGTVWSQVPGGGMTNWTSVYGSSATDVWIGGNAVELLHWNGMKLEVVSSGQASWILRIWGSGPSDYWASTTGTSKLIRWDGSKWSNAGFSYGGPIGSIWGSGRNDVWFFNGNAVHWNGTQFSPKTVVLPLHAVWGTGPNDVWSVGGQRIARWNGGSWVNQVAPMLDTSTNEVLRGISGVRTDDVWTVSYRPHHWDGAAWDSPGGGVRGTYYAGSAIGPDDAWVVGTDEASMGIVMKRTGGRWIPSIRTMERLLDIWVYGPNNVWIVGRSGWVMNWNGSNWNRISSGTLNDLNGVFGVSANFIVIVGTNGTILNWDGKSLNSMTSGTSESIIDVWGVSDKEFFVCGSGGLIMYWDGKSWSKNTTGATSNLRAIWGQSSKDVWVTGNSGLILRWDGSLWSRIISGTTADLIGIYSIDSRNVWVASGGSLIRWDGTNWQPAPVATETIRSVFGYRENIWVSGSFGAILKYVP